MQKGIYERTNKGLGFELTNSMSFDKSRISIGFIQKTVKGDLFIKKKSRNYSVASTWEGSKGL
jgi:hypothetical protein